MPLELWPRVRRRARAVPQRIKARWYLRGVGSLGRGVYVAGRPFLKRARDIHIGAFVAIHSEGAQVRLGGPGEITIGEWSFLNAGCFLEAHERITIEDNVAVSLDVFITDSNGHGMEGGPLVSAPVTIKSGAWIGAKAVVLPGVTIGRRAVVGAGAVVTRDVPDDTLVVGQPARVVRQLVYPQGVVRAWA